MKKTLTILVPALLFIFSFTVLFNSEKVEEPIGIQTSTVEYDMPADVKAVLEKSCMGCHNEASSNTKGKMKLNFDKFNDGSYSTGKKIAKLNGTAKVVDGGKMPPKKFLAKYPDRALSAEQAKLVSEWAKAQAEALAGE